ncbi:MAG: sigma 54-interacting transcriptional regulator [Firmicutes bacterium]|nr:sigma 54-interacting transcriptional regulator [Bacillota bacterium]
MGKILFIAPEEETAQLVGKLEDSLGIDVGVDIVVAVGEERLKLLATCSERGIEVVVSRWGYSLRRARQVSDVPLVNVEITGYDIARALNAARAVSDRVGVAHMSNVVKGASMLAPLLGMKFVGAYVLDSDRPKALHDAIRRMRDLGVEVLLGGIAVTSLAASYGIQGLRIKAGEEALAAALLEAWRLIPVKQRERERTENIRAILDFAYDGIIALDKNGIITVFNPMAEQITRLKASNVIGKPIDFVMPELRGTDILALKTGPEVGKIRNIGGVQVITNRIPIVLDGRPVGAVVNFLDIGRIQGLEAKARKALATRGLVARVHFSDIIGSSRAMSQLVEMAKRYSQMDSPILICGETGTGKEMFAQAIHNASPRANGPFVAVNCAALPESLLESELFGYVEGAFTGARKQGKAGLFELAHRGTIFLDEVSEMPLSVQARFLRVIQEKEVIRLGDDRVIPVDIRIIAATNKDLEALVQEGNFRKDLYYRLDVLNLMLPPLRERGKEDIRACLEYFMRKCELRLGHPLKELDPEDMEVVLNYRWPGNIRELENFVERIGALADPGDGSMPPGLVNSMLSSKECPGSHGRREGGEEGGCRSLREMELEAIERALKECGGSKRRAAALLGISQTTLWRRLKTAGKSEGENA